jgi:hypothetical protein
MLCKLELNVIKTMAEKEYAEEQKRLDGIAQENFQHIKEETISYCENELNKIFREKAEKREVLTFTKKFHLEKDRIGNTLAYGLSLDGYRYADGDFSWRPDEKEVFDLKTMEAYLKEHCFSIDYEDSTYRRYGLGYLESTTMTISAE